MELPADYTYTAKVHMHPVQCGAVRLLNALVRTDRPHRALTVTLDPCKVTCSMCQRNLFKKRKRAK